MTNANEEMRNSGPRDNFPGFEFPLEFCPIRPKHKTALIRAVWASHRQLRGYIGWAKYARSWNTRTFAKFVDDHINALLPNQHFVFLIGEEIVGMGSLVGAYSPNDSQIALWVRTGYQGKGIGKAMVETLEYVAFNVWGFHTLYYEHDYTNESSKKLPQKCGFTFSHTRDIEKSAELESGLWFCWKKERPDHLPDAIIQGRPIDDYTKP
jgi:RimJ/RimL family protein N-acetyltransferase